MRLLCLICGLICLFFQEIRAMEAIPERITYFVEKMKTLMEPEAVRYVGFVQGERELLFQEAVKLEEIFVPQSGGWKEVLAGDGEGGEKGASISVATPFNELGYSANMWEEEQKATKRVFSTFSKAMRGRVMYVIPYALGVSGSVEKPVLQITDSPFVALCVMTLARTGKEILSLFENDFYIKSLHCKGSLSVGKKKQESYLVSFLQKKEIWAFGREVTIDQIRKEIVHRLLSSTAHEEGWVATHMPIFSLTNPEGKTRYGLLLLPPSLSIIQLFQRETIPGWSLQLVSSDSSWIYCKDGSLMALNPEIGFFGALLGPLSSSLRKELFAQALFSGVSFTEEKDLWWEGKESVRPWKLFDGKGKEWSKKGQKSFFVLSYRKSSVLNSESLRQIPVSMIVVCSLKKNIYPLVRELNSWTEGVLMASLLPSENEKQSLASFDPFAMRDFCGVNLGVYLKTWIDLRDNITSKNKCRFFTVNLASQGSLKEDQQLPSLPMMKWCFERCEERVEAQKTSFGFLPNDTDIDLPSIAPSCSYEELFSIDKPLWQKELLDLKVFLKKWNDQVPLELAEQILFSGSS